MFWRTSSVILTRFFLRNGPFFLRVFEGCMVIPISTFLSPAPMPSFLFTSQCFQTQWFGSKMHSSTLGTSCQPMPSHRLLCSGRSCRECLFLTGLSLVLVALLWPQKDGLPGTWLVCACGEGLSGSPEPCVFFDRDGSGC